jgi:hypothetical protein
MALRRFDRGAAAERISKLERRTLRLYAAVLRGKTLSAWERGDKAIVGAYPGRKARGMERVTVTTLRRGILMDMDEMKRQYRAKQEQIRKLEAERAEILRRGQPVPWRIGYRLEMTRIEAEELRMWGHRQLVRTIREGV